MVVQKLAPCVVGLTGKVKKLSFGQLVSVSPLKRFRSNKNKTFLSLQFGPTALTSKKTSTENRLATVPMFVFSKSIENRKNQTGFIDFKILGAGHHHALL
jgi:hypothetical protein